MKISSEHFEFLCLSNPTAAFAELFEHFSHSLKDSPKIAEAFASFQGHFKVQINTIEDAHRLDALKAQGAEKLGINVGSLPLAMSAGFAFCYDTAIEALQRCDVRIHPRMITARSIRTAERLLDMLALQIGALNVTALDLALRDESYAARLRQRAGELTKVVSFQGISGLGDNPFNCEFCTLTYTGPDGETETVCGTSEKECSSWGLWLILILLIFLTIKLLQWLF